MTTPADDVSHRPSPAAEARALLARARDLRGKKDLVEAVHMLEQAIASLSENGERAAPGPTRAQAGAPASDRALRAQLEFELGQLLEEELGRLDGALLHYQRAFKLRPEVTEPLHRGRAIYRRLGDVAMVSRLYELELSSAPAADPTATLLLALDFARHKLAQQHDPGAAARILEAALQGLPADAPASPQHAEALETLAQAYVSPDYQPEEGAEAQAERAAQIFLSLGTRRLQEKGEDEQALSYLRRALGADPLSVPAALALETSYAALPSPRREEELLRLYRTGARVKQRGLKLLRLYEGAGGQDPGKELLPEELREIVAACRADLERAETLGEWEEIRGALRRCLAQLGGPEGLSGQALLLQEDAQEAALPEERAALQKEAAEVYRKAGDSGAFLAALRLALAETPRDAEVFRRLGEYHAGRRDFGALAEVHEARLAALLQEPEALDPEAYLKMLEDLADLYERRLQDAGAAADVWRRIDEFWPGPRSQAELRRLGQRLSRIQLQVGELQMELDRTPPEAAGKRADILRRLGQLYREQHDRRQAAALYEELLLFTPNDGQALKALFELRELCGDVPGQLDVLRQQVALAGDRAERLGLLRRVVALSAPDPAQVEVLSWACRALLQELPSDRDALRRLAEAEERLGQSAALIETLEAHAKIAPTPRDKLPLHLQLAQLLEQAGGENLARAAQHLERAVRLCPPGPESEGVLLELARVYGRQGRLQEQLQALEFSLRQNKKPSLALLRQLGAATMVQPRDPKLEERSLRAWREVLQREPNDIEALDALSALHRARGEWRDLCAVLARRLALPDQAPEKRLAVALDLAEVLSARLDDRPGALEVLLGLQAETPICDRQLHHRLRILHEELGRFEGAIRHAECQLLLSDDPLLRLELAMQIAALWRHRAKDPGRALLSYERVLELLPQAAPESLVAREGRRVIARAMDMMSELHSEAGDWQRVVALGDQRLALAQGEPMRAACILLELAAVCEEKLGDARRGFALRQRAFELAPEMVPLKEMIQVAQGAGLYAELYQLLRRSLPTGPEAPVLATTPGAAAQVALAELGRLLRTAPEGAGFDKGGPCRDLLGVYHAFVDELCGQRGAGTEDTALRIHRLLGACARLREEVLADPRGALEERLRALSLGGDRDHGSSAEADAVFAETLAELRRLAIAAGQVKEALLLDTRRLEKADTPERRQAVACDAASWLEDAVNDPPRALRACLKALPLCAEGSDAQADMRGRLYRLAAGLGALAWEDFARCERGLALPRPGPAALRRRLLYIASLWEGGAEDVNRAIEATGQAYRLTFFPTLERTRGDALEKGDRPALPDRGRRASLPPPPPAALDDDDAPVEDLSAEEDRQIIRAELFRLAQGAQTEAEGLSRVVALFDGIAAQLTEGGDTVAAIEVLLDAARTDEKRGRVPHAERRYQEILKIDPGCEEALAQLERLYRQNRRLADLAALLERRRSGLLEQIPPGPARQAMLGELADLYLQLGKSFEALEVLGAMAVEDEADPEPHLRMARVHENQRAFARAAESYGKAAERAGRSAPAQQALLRSGEIFEKQIGSPDRALAAYQGALQLLAEAEPSRQALAGVERLLGRLRREGELAAILTQALGEARGAAGAESADPGLRAELLQRLLQLHLGAREPDLEGALRCAEELSALRPDDDAVLAQEEQLLERLGRREAGRDVARRRAAAAQARGAAPEEQAARQAALAQWEMRLNNPAAAGAALEQAVALRPDDLPTLQALAELRRVLGDYTGHVEALQKVAQREPDGTRAAQVLLTAARVCLRDLGDPERAGGLLELALDRAPPEQAPEDADSPGRQALSLLSDLSHDLGDAQSAEAYARRELGTAPAPARAIELHSRLGHLLLERGLRDQAQDQFLLALKLQPGLLGPTRELVRLLSESGDHAWVESLLQATLFESNDEAIAASERAVLLRQRAAASRALGKQEETYEALLQAEQLHAGSAAEQCALGELAHDLGHHETALRYLGPFLSAQPGSALEKERRVQALIRGARSALALGQPGPARALLEGALRLEPDAPAAIAPYVEVLLGAGAGLDDLRRAEELLLRLAQQQTRAGEPLAAAQHYRDAARTAARRADRQRSRELLAQALALLPAELVGAAELIEELGVQLVDLLRQAGNLEEARAHAEKLLQVTREPHKRAARLRQLAELDLAAGEREPARQHLLLALDAAPQDIDTLLVLVSVLPDPELVELLPPALEELPEGAAGDERLVRLWSALGAAQARLGQARDLAGSYDKAIESARGLDRSVELALRRAALDHLGGAEEEPARRHLEVLLAEDPLDRSALAELLRLEERTGNAGAALRVRQVLQVLAPDATGSPPMPAVPPIPTGAAAALEEADHARIAPAEARTLAEVLATLWEGVAGSKAAPLESFGVGAPERLPPTESSPDEVARHFAVCCRVLGNRRANLYRNPKLDRAWPLLCAHPPTALVIGRGLSGRPAPVLLFLLGRTVELLRPEYLLAEATLRPDGGSEAELARLFGLAVRAFHPRHIRHSGEAVAAWRRDLPYRAVKRLSDLFKEHAETPFSTVAWRRAARRAGNRAGLLLCGDLAVAAEVLRGAEYPFAGEAEDDLRDLVGFWLSPAAALADRVHPAK